MMGAQFPGHVPALFGEQHGVNFPGHMGGNFPGMGRNVPGAMGPGFGPSCGHMDSMNGHGHHCCNPVRNGCNPFAHGLPSDCGQCGHHTQDFPSNANFSGPGPNQGRWNPMPTNGPAGPNQARENSGANWNRPGAVDPSLALQMPSSNGRGNGNLGKFGNVTFRNVLGSGKPIRNTSNFIQRGSGPY